MIIGTFSYYHEITLADCARKRQAFINVATGVTTTDELTPLDDEL